MFAADARPDACDLGNDCQLSAQPVGNFSHYEPRTGPGNSTTMELFSEQKVANMCVPTRSPCDGSTTIGGSGSKLLIIDISVILTVLTTAFLASASVHPDIVIQCPAKAAECDNPQAIPEDGNFFSRIPISLGFQQPPSCVPSNCMIPDYAVQALERTLRARITGQINQISSILGLIRLQLKKHDPRPLIMPFTGDHGVCDTMERFLPGLRDWQEAIDFCHMHVERFVYVPRSAL